jgi:hypothetical protein
MKKSLLKWVSTGIGFALLLSALSAPAWANPVRAPEMDPGLATSAMALISGGLLLITGRARRR